MAVLAAVLVAGCSLGGGDDDSSSEEPRLLSVPDLRKHPAGSPEAALLRHFFFIQWGSARNLLGSLEPGVVKRVGVPDLVNAYAFLRPGLAAAKLRMAGKLKTSQGTLMTYEIVPTTGPIQTESALLRKVKKGHVVSYDTLLERGIPGSIRASFAEEPQSVQRDRRIARRIAAVMRRYHAAAGIPRLRSPVARPSDGEASGADSAPSEAQPPATAPQTIQPQPSR